MFGNVPRVRRGRSVGGSIRSDEMRSEPTFLLASLEDHRVSEVLTRASYARADRRSYFRRRWRRATEDLAGSPGELSRLWEVGDSHPREII
jgi:hypothetical protein